MIIGKDEPSLKGMTKATSNNNLSRITQKTPLANYQGQLRHQSNDYTSENATNKMIDSEHTQEEVKIMHQPSESLSSALNNMNFNKRHASFDILLHPGPTPNHYKIKQQPN